MPYTVEVTADAELDLEWLDRIEAVSIRQALPIYLRNQPDVPTRRRKRLDPIPAGATWKLRLDELRVYHDIDQVAQRVLVLRVGRKIREQVTIRGVVTDMREARD